MAQIEVRNAPPAGFDHERRCDAGGGDLNGRRWAGHQLLRSWARFAGDSPLALAHADPKTLLGFAALA